MDAPDFSADVRNLAYPERRLLVVDDEARQAMQSSEAGESRSRAWLTAAAGIAAMTVTPAGILVGVAAQQLGRRRPVDKPPVLVIGQKEAELLSFPLGHPRKSVVYVGHPGIAGAYYPMANFHRILFEEKAAEALRLLRSLAAVEINIEYIEGFKQSGSVDFSVAAPPSAPADAGVHAGLSKDLSSSARVTMRLDPEYSPSIPADLIWFRSEPLWREVADARMVSGLRDFQIEVLYSDDFGVDAQLNAKIAQVGLSAGGKFTEFRNTHWKLTGTFKSA